MNPSKVVYRLVLAATMVLCFLWLSTTPLHAQTNNSWIDGSGKWETGANWSFGVPPSASDGVDFIANAATKTVTIDATTVLSNSLNGCMSINNLYIAGTATSTNTLALNNAGTITPLQVLISAGSGPTLDTNGALVANNSVVLAVNSYLVVGSAGGNASFTVSNHGQVVDWLAWLGNSASSSNNVALVTGAGSVWSNRNFVGVGNLGPGNQLTIANGGHVVDNYAYLGSSSSVSSSNNTALVTGNGSVWSNNSYLYVGYFAPSNQLTIANGGKVVSGQGDLGCNPTSPNNVALVTGSGSIWNGGIMVVGQDSPGNMLTVSNGGQLASSSGYVGMNAVCSNNVVLVTGSGSVWSSSSLYLGYYGASNQLTIANDGQVTNGFASLGFYSSGSNNSALVTGAGSIWSNQSLYIGFSSPGNQLTVSNIGSVFANPLVLAQNAGSSGTLTLDGGTVNVGGLIITNAGGVAVFNSGTLISSSTSVTNNQTFLVGDETELATFRLNGGVHSFANNLEIRNNASLAGCGTVTGNVLVDAGGAVLANCGGTLNFTGTVTNNSTISAVSGTTLNFFGPLINNGAIVATNGAVNIHSTFQNNGTVTGVANSWTDGNGKWETAANWLLNSVPSTSDAADTITNAGNNTVIIDATTVLSNAVNGCLTINNLTVSAPSGATNTLFLNNAGPVTALQVFSVLTLGTNGAMVVNNSAAQSTNSVNISSASSSLTVTNGGSLVVTNGSRTGSVVVNGGSLILGTAAFEADNLIVTNGGTVQNTQTNQLNNGSATVASGSLVATNAPTTIGSLSNSVASLSVSSNATVLISLTTLAAGADSTASLTLQGTATMQVLSNLTAGSGAGSTASVSIVGGQLTATNGVIGIGNNGSTTNGFGYGQMTVSNSSVLANQILLGSSAGGHGDLTIQSNGVVSLVGSNALLVPDGVTIDGGELDIDDGEIQCGSGANFPGSLTMSSGTANCMLIYVGDASAGTLTISGGQMNVSPLIDIGFNAGSAGAVWMNGGVLTSSAIILGDSGVGQLSLSNNGIIQVSSSFSVGACGAPGAAGTLTVAGGNLTSSGPVNVGAGSLWVSGGQLQVPSLVIGYNNYGVGKLTISNGSVQVNSLVLTNGANSQIALVGGSLSSGGTVVTNTQGFVVGNSINAATFAMAGGTHWFANGLEVANNATLTGCGTINGTVTIDAGAHAVATCGTVTFGNTVTINGNGVVRALNGSTLSFSGPVVNNGAIDVLNGSATFNSPPTGTGYILTTNCLPVITSIQRVGSDIHVSFTTGANAPYAVNYKTDMVTATWTILTNVTGTGGSVTIVDSAAALQPKRFYQVNLVVPP